MEFHLSEGSEICGDQLSLEIKEQTGLDLGRGIQCMITCYEGGYVTIPDATVAGYEDEITAIVEAHNFNPDYELLEMPLDDLKALALERVQGLDAAYAVAIEMATTNQQVVDVLNSLEGE